MISGAHIFLQLAQNVSLFALVVLVYASIRPRAGRLGRGAEGAALGGVFGIAAVLAMMVPIHLAEGVIVDGRAITIGLAALFVGPLAGATAMLIAMAYRIWLGGIGVEAGLCSLLLACMLGSAFCLGLRRDHQKLRIGSLVLFSLLLGFLAPASLLLLPEPDLVSIIVRTTMMPLILTIIVGAILFGMMLLNEDQRAQLQHDLAEQTDTLRSIIDSMGDGLIVADPDGRYRLLNPAASRIAGVGPLAPPLEQWPSIYGLFRSDGVTPLPVDDVPLLLALRGKATDDVEIVMRPNRQAPGKTLSISGRPIRDRLGQLRGGLVLFRDISERKTAEAALQDSEERYRFLAENATEMITRVDLDGRRIYVSPACQDLLGYHPAELFGTRFAKFVHHEDLARTEALLLRLCSGERWRDTLVYRMQHRDGSAIWVHTTFRVIADESGAPAELLCLVRNFTDRKEFEDQLAAAKDQAEQASRAKSDFLAMMSHEIRTPMNGIIGMSGLLLDTRLSEEQAHYVKALRESGESLLRILNDILDYSKIEAGRLELDNIELDLPGLVQSVVALLRPRAQDKGLELRLDLGGGLPACVIADPGRLRQILFNLIGNAIKFTEHGHVLICIRHEVIEAGLVALRVEVSDTGIGISPLAQHRLFDRFSQGDPSINRKYGGTGLGLAISKQLVSMMQGEIGFRSSPGNGSTFWFTICCRLGSTVAPSSQAEPGREPTAAMGAATSIPVVPAPATARSIKRVLVAEDNQINQLLIVSMLGKLGFDVALANNGLEAVEKVQQQDVDLVLMDAQMPAMDGIEATAAIRRLPQPFCDVPIVALTANAMSGDRDTYMAAGMDDYVAKPIRLPELLAAIRRCDSARAGTAIQTSWKGRD